MRASGVIYVLRGFLALAAFTCTPVHAHYIECWIDVASAAPITSDSVDALIVDEAWRVHSSHEGLRGGDEVFAQKLGSYTVVHYPELQKGLWVYVFSTPDTRNSLEEAVRDLLEGRLTPIHREAIAWSKLRAHQYLFLEVKMLRAIGAKDLMCSRFD